MKRASKKIKKTLPVLWGLALLLGNSSCMVISNTDVEEQSNSNSQMNNAVGPGLPVRAPAGMMAAASLATYDNVLRNMNKVTGTTPSAATLQNYNQNKTTFAQKGTPDEINAAMWLSVSTLAANVCQDLYNNENASPASRKFFLEVNFGGTTNFSAVKANGDTAEQAMIRRMFLAFWGMDFPRTDANVTDVVSALNSISGTRTALSAADTKKALLIACTGILASLKSIEN